MHIKTTLKLLPLVLFCGTYVQAQQMDRPAHKLYVSTGAEGFILSTTVQQKMGEATHLSTPRFTGLVNIGLNVNFDFTKRAGIYAGLSIKNIGFIEQFSNPDSTVKRRVYAFGIPMALKLGDVKYGSYLLVGGGVDFPFNYREKGFVKRGDKTKFNEWFSERTPRAMPYFFVGVHLRPAFTFKLQYYPFNFMNSGFSYIDPVQGFESPYRNYNVKLLMLTAGFDIPYAPKK